MPNPPPVPFAPEFVRDPSAIQTKVAGLARPTSAEHPVVAKGQKVGSCVFQVLTATELTYVYAAAHFKAAKAINDPDTKPGMAYDQIYADQSAIELVFVACRQVDDHRFPVWQSADHIRRDLTDDEITALARAYAIYRLEQSPLKGVLEDAHCEAVARLLSKGKSRMLLGSYTTEALGDIIEYLVRTYVPAPPASSADGDEPVGPLDPPVGDATPH